jgi:hypothetical protein
VPDKCRPHGVCAAGGECACEGGFVGEGCGEAAAAAAHLRAEFAIDAAAVLATPAARALFVAAFKADLSAALGINATRIVINGMAAGSLVVDFLIVPGNFLCPRASLSLFKWRSV